VTDRWNSDIVDPIMEHLQLCGEDMYYFHLKQEIDEYRKQIDLLRSSHVGENQG